MKDQAKLTTASLDPILQLKIIRQSRQLMEKTNSRTQSQMKLDSKNTSPKLFHFGPTQHPDMKQDPQLNQLINITSCLEETFDNDLS